MANKLLSVEENTKFFDFIETMLKEGKRFGMAKIKDGAIPKLKGGAVIKFRYITDGETAEGKRIHYISLQDGTDDY